MLAFFVQVLAELEGDEKFSRFRKEYEKLHNALRKAHDNETRLIEKCSQLNQELMANASKVGTAMKMDQDAQQSIGLLKKVGACIFVVLFLYVRYVFVQVCAFVSPLNVCGDIAG